MARLNSEKISIDFFYALCKIAESKTIDISVYNLLDKKMEKFVLNNLQKFELKTYQQILFEDKEKWPDILPAFSPDLCEKFKNDYCENSFKENYHEYAIPKIVTVISSLIFLVFY